MRKTYDNLMLQCFICNKYLERVPMHYRGVVSCEKDWEEAVKERNRQLDEKIFTFDLRLKKERNSN